MRDIAAAIDEADRQRRLPIIVGGTGLYFKALCEGLDKPEWVARFADFSEPTQASLQQDLKAVFLTRTRDEWMNTLPADCCLTPVLNLAQALEQPQFSQRGMVIDDGKGRRRLSVPGRFSDQS